MEKYLFKIFILSEFTKLNSYFIDSGIIVLNADGLIDWQFVELLQDHWIERWIKSWSFVSDRDTGSC